MLHADEINSVLSREKLEASLPVTWPSAGELERVLADTPGHLRHIVHYALAWGIADDGYRSDFLDRTHPDMQKNLKWVASTHDDELDEWLAGDEANAEHPSDAYVAFSCFRMASDEV